MNMSKFKWMVMPMILVVLFTAVGCDSGNSQDEKASAIVSESSDTSVVIEGNGDPFYKYPSLVSLTAGMEVPSVASNLPQGHTPENNEYTRYFESISNIKVTSKFEAAVNDPYKQKVKLAIASNDLPDFMVIRNGDYLTFKEMVDLDMLEDLTPYYNNCLDPKLKEIYETSGGEALKQCTFNGKIMALPDVTAQGNMPSFLWVRQDWLDKLGLEAPKTVDDIINVSKAFINGDPDGNGENDTIGLMANKNIAGAEAQLFGLDAIFNAYHSYPKMWIKDDNGNVTYGSITPETKTALTKLAEMYREGVIDKEFAVRKDEKTIPASGKNGLLFGPSWIAWSPLGATLKNDIKAEWKPILAPLDGNGEFSYRKLTPCNSYLVVKKGCKNPDAVIRYFNFVQRFERLEDPAATSKGTTIYKDIKDLQYKASELTSIRYTLDYADTFERKFRLYSDALEGKVDTTTLTEDDQIKIMAIKMEMETPRKDIRAWPIYVAFMEGGKLLTDNPIVKGVDSVFYGQTKTMETKWETLKRLESETMLKIIMGQENPDYFDTFVEKWKKMGGEDITEEVSAILNGK